MSKSTAVLTFIGSVLCAAIVFWVAVGWAAVHFIVKFW